MYNLWYVVELPFDWIMIANTAFADINVHGDCQDFASKCMPCMEKRVGCRTNEYRRHGSVLISFLQARDIFLVPSGTSLYCSYKLGRSDRVFKSEAARISEGECRWSSEMKARQLFLSGKLLLTDIGHDNTMILLIL